MAIKSSKQDLIDNVKEYLNNRDVFFVEKANGHLVIEGVNYWATKDKWHSPKESLSGVGINSLLKHLQL